MNTSRYETEEFKEEIKKGIEIAEKGGTKRKELTEGQKKGLIIGHKNRKISRIKTLEKKFSDPSICEEIQRKKNTKEMYNLTHEIIGLESDITSLFGKESEYINRSKKIKDKLMACMKGK